MDGKKDVLGMWVGENESAKFWAGVLNSMRNRGVEDILIACTDNLTGFSQAIEAVFPQTDIQNCIIHQLRNSSKYVSYKDLKALTADLKKVYTAVDEESAMSALDDFATAWDSKYPKISKPWYDNWANLSTYFKFPQEMRKLIYTTNTIEGFNRQLKKVTKSKSVFPTDDSLFKMLYLAMKDITKKWTGRRQDWSRIYAQLIIYYGDRIPDWYFYLDNRIIMCYYADKTVCFRIRSHHIFSISLFLVYTEFGIDSRQNRQQLVREDDFSLFALIGLDYRRNRYSISSLS